MHFVLSFFSFPTVHSSASMVYFVQDAWKFSRNNGREIVTINPTMVIGPLLQPTLNTSSEAILKQINGTCLDGLNFPK